MLIRFTRNLLRFVPNSVKIVMWNWRKKLFRENFSQILCKPKAILYQNWWNFAQLSAILFWVRIKLRKFTQVLSYIVCTQVRRHVHKKITEVDTGKKSQDVLFSENQFCSLSVWDLLRLRPWVFWSEIFTRCSSLCLLRFCWDLSSIFVRQDWQWFFNKPLQGLTGRFVCVLNCLILFVCEYSYVWPEICHVLSQIQWRFLRGISGKNYFGEFFRNFVQTKGYPLPKLVKFRPTFCNFILGLYCAEKIHTSTFICCFHPSKKTRP